ncbi:hypothetical protein CNY89_01180 [Amaricoccus sp. HAR-UPW-R2A-40]|nr:hypothetical protein CNY89_01180 [Amaricoccus sp. HAR-UPW-R2A-40]
MGVSPLTIKMAIAYYVSPTSPEQFFTPETWACAPAREARDWLFENDLLYRDETADITHLAPKLAAWVDFICATPLPVQEWRLPEREGARPYRSEPHG